MSSIPIPISFGGSGVTSGGTSRDENVNAYRGGTPVGASSPAFVSVGTPKSRMPSIISQLSPLMITQGIFGGAGGGGGGGGGGSNMIGSLGSTGLGFSSLSLGPSFSGGLNSTTHASLNAAATGTSASTSPTSSTSSSSTSSSNPPQTSADSNARKTKIICTLGPATAHVEVLVSLLQAGMNIARFNFSHGSHAGHLEMLNRLRQAITQSGIDCAFLLDTKGPEIRTGLLKNGPIQLSPGDEVFLRTDCTPEEHRETYHGDPSEGISVDYPRLAHVLHIGSQLKLDDGLISSRVVDCFDGSIGSGGEVSSPKRGVLIRIENQAILGERKGINLPGTQVDLPAVTDRDKEDLRFAIEHGFHFIAASFTRHASGVQEIRNILAEKPAGRQIQIIAKIENQQGLDNFESILREADGIMVARGDLGVEVPIQRVSTYQKTMIKRCNAAGKPVVTATQMLESMSVNPRPTRAEATDVSNAVFDGSDCVMLSGETAKGAYPIEAVQIMSAICVSSERAMDYPAIYASIVQQQVGIQLKKSEALTMSAVKVAQDLGSRAIIVFSESGHSARLVAKYRPAAPIILLTPSPITQRQSRLLRGVWSLKVDRDQDANLVTTALSFAKQKGWIQEGQNQTVILVSGNQVGVTGATNTMRIVDV